MMVLKKIFSRLLFPVPLCLELLLVGLLLLWFTRKQKAGRVVVTLAGVLLFLFSSHFFSSMLLTPLESTYPALFVAQAPVPAGLREAKFIVVLSSGFLPEADRPVAIQLDEGSAVRLVEGVRMSKALNGCKLVLSGGAGPGSVSSPAEAMAQLAQELGVGRQDMILETHSRDTEEEARLVAPIVGEQPFILVTEASHMPRSMALFRKQGTHPIADPVDYRTSHTQPIVPDHVFPDAEELRGSQRAVYEYLGLAWEKIRGQI